VPLEGRLGQVQLFIDSPGGIPVADGDLGWLGGGLQPAMAPPTRPRSATRRVVRVAGFRVQTSKRAASMAPTLLWTRATRCRGCFVQPRAGCGLTVSAVPC
jgi:hypothetical protein